MKLFDEFRHNTLYARTTLTITLASAIFLLFTLTLLAIFVIIPTAERSAGEMASLVLLSAESLRTGVPERQEGYRKHVFEAYEIDLFPPPDDLYPRRRHAPFFLLLEHAFEQRLGRKVTILQTDLRGRENNYWVNLNTTDNPLYVGFEYSHKSMDPPLIIIIIIVVGLLATFITGITLAQRLTQPLKQLAISSRQLGSGENIQPLTETGPLELRELVSSFNRMSQKIQDLLANRTTLLAGISHDLRTPLTRMELSIEMLENGADPALFDQLRRDIGQMNKLIGLFLEVSRGLQQRTREKVDIAGILCEVVNDFQSTGANLTYRPGRTYTAMLHPLALKRIVINLMENAIRYSNAAEVILRYRVLKDRAIIEVLDRGPGIPESERKAVFRPFYRLEHSRNSDTGGSGLGLSIVKQLAEANGCRVELLPRTGGGTKARITILDTGES